MDGDLSTSTETPQVPPVNWKALDGIDWSVPLIFVGIYFGFYLFGMMMAMVGFFCSLWAVWTGFMLYNYGVGSILVNPGWILGRAFVLAGITWLVVKAFSLVTQTPVKVFRHFTR